MLSSNLIPENFGLFWPLIKLKLVFPICLKIFTSVEFGLYSFALSMKLKYEIMSFISG